MTTVILNQPDEPQDVPGVVIPVPPGLLPVSECSGPATTSR